MRVGWVNLIILGMEVRDIKLKAVPTSNSTIKYQGGRRINETRSWGRVLQETILPGRDQLSSAYLVEWLPLADWQCNVNDKGEETRNGGLMKKGRWIKNVVDLLTCLSRPGLAWPGVASSSDAGQAF
jgi:hypothetical protein